ncbi:MAG: hypothetical protein U5N21_04825 [Rhodococcus sp. (in: high G+C Gram-positive bacteria)]|nr:hypothetical protein [Rhodococcus sp. (in: high G+C Gram-positive bacteria)]
MVGTRATAKVPAQERIQATRDGTGHRRGASTKYVERPEVKLYKAFLVEHRQQTSMFGLSPASEGAASRGSTPTDDGDGVPNPFAGTP